MGRTDPLELTGPVHVAATADELYDDLAREVMSAGVQSVDSRGVFHLALSGGSTPEPFYQRLVTDARYRMIPWRHTHVWIVDERRVPVEDERSNFRMLREVLIDHVPVPKRQVHEVPVDVADPATAYESELRSEIPADPDLPRLDFVLLGMGGDTHTASLFPGSPALTADGLIANNEVPPGTNPDVPRVTMTFVLLNAARMVAVLVTGSGKAAALGRVHQQLATGPDPTALPITGVQPSPGSLVWYLDAAAAGA